MRLQRHPRWRGLLKDAVASAIWRAYEHAWSGTRQTGRALVVGYHRVVDDFAVTARTDMPTMLISRAMFERHMDWIGRRFQFVGLDEIGDHVARGVPFRRPVAAVTFDDGYSDVYENAFPILKRKGIPAGFFVVTELVGRESWQVHDKLYHLAERAHAGWSDPWTRVTKLLGGVGIEAAAIPGLRSAVRSPHSFVSSLLPAISRADTRRIIELLSSQVSKGTASGPTMLTWPMIAEMRAAGCTIGSHTRTHVWLANETEERSAEELAGSKSDLETRLGEPVEHFAYPGGQFTSAVVDRVERAGYRYAYTVCDHQNPRFPALTIQRLILWEGSSIGAGGRFSSTILNCQTHGLWPPARRCERVHAA